MEALEHFKKVRIPHPFNEPSKSFFNPRKNNRNVNMFGVGIKITPDLLFRTSYKGEKIIGGIKLHCRKKFPLDEEHRKVASYLLCEHLKRNVAEEDEKVLEEFCLFVDVLQQKVSIAPLGSEVSFKGIRNLCEEYAEIWKRVEKG